MSEDEFAEEWGVNDDIYAATASGWGKNTKIHWKLDDINLRDTAVNWIQITRKG